MWSAMPLRRGLLVNLVAEDASRAEIPFLCEILSHAYRWGAQKGFYL